MSVQVEERPVRAEQTSQVVAPAVPAVVPPAPAGAPAADTAGPWERAWLWVALVVLFGAVVFGAMYVLTMLAGGPGYPY
ncbi:hypothetical protein ACWKWC_12655 [Geodermatophilus nigrescens]